MDFRDFAEKQNSVVAVKEKLLGIGCGRFGVKFEVDAESMS